jgi:hypothetical protein
MRSMPSCEIAERVSATHPRTIHGVLANAKSRIRMGTCYGLGQISGRVRHSATGSTVKARDGLRRRMAIGGLPNQSD